MRKTLQCVFYDKTSGVCPTSVPLSYIMLHISRYSVISCQRDQCVICDGWVEMRRRPFSPMCDAASSQLVVTTNDRPSIPICPIVHNTENIDRPLAGDLTAKKIFWAAKSAHSHQSINAHQIVCYLYQSGVAILAQEI